jgi:hypothetical protein
MNYYANTTETPSNFERSPNTNGVLDLLCEPIHGVHHEAIDMIMDEINDVASHHSFNAICRDDNRSTLVSFKPVVTL